MDKKKFIKLIVVNAIILAAISFFYIIDKRVCLIYNIFKIPCAGCGLTRSLAYLIHGDFINSFRYNIMTIPLIIVYLVYLVLKIIDIKNNTNKMEKFISKHKKVIIFGAVCLFVVSQVKNIFNPLLY